MSEPFLSEIRPFAFDFNPLGWASCDGQLLPISQNSALFSLIGVAYGGDGRTTFGLPDLRGRAPIHQGRGHGLTRRRLGSRGGSEWAILSANQIPNHRHNVSASSNVVTVQNPPTNNYPAANAASPGFSFYHGTQNGDFKDNTIQSTGGGQAHYNLQPSLALNFCIALVGLFPSRS